MSKLLTLKQIALRYNVTTQRVQRALQQVGIVPRSLSNHEIRDLQWDGVDKRVLKSTFIDSDEIESNAFKIEVVKGKSQHEINETLGQLTLNFE